MSSLNRTGLAGCCKIYVKGPRIVITDISFDETVGMPVFTVTPNTVFAMDIHFCSALFMRRLLLNFETVNGFTWLGRD